MVEFETARKLSVKPVVTGPTMSFAKDITAPKVAAQDPVGPSEQGGDGRGCVLSWKGQAIVGLTSKSTYCVSSFSAFPEEVFAPPVTDGGSDCPVRLHCRYEAQTV